LIGASGADLKVAVASKPIDFRKGVNGLVALVADALMADPYCGDVFVFRSKRSDRLKILLWDGSGLVLATKWLEEGAFTWPAPSVGKVVITPAQMAMLLAGLNWMAVTPTAVKRPLKVG
jgi:transposase